MKSILKYTIFLILIFGIKNNNLFSQAEETWGEIDFNDKIDGEWEGNAISLVRSNINNTEFESNLNISIIFNYKKGDKFVSSVVKFDFTDYLTDLENVEEMKEKGYTKKNMWEMFKNALKTDFFKFDHYSLFFETTELAVEYFASDSRGKFLMNKNKDLLLLIYYEPSFILGIGDSGFTKMTFKKILRQGTSKNFSL